MAWRIADDAALHPARLRTTVLMLKNGATMQWSMSHRDTLRQTDNVHKV